MEALCLLPVSLFGMRSFYVVRKRTAARHNKWTNGAIRKGFVEGVRSSKGLDTLIALLIPTSLLFMS